MAKDCRVFSGVSVTAFQRMAADIRQRGWQFPDGTEGDITAQGVHASYRYEEAHQTLEICIITKPIFLPASAIWSALQGAVDKYVV